jgi:hypothetical protein
MIRHIALALTLSGLVFGCSLVSPEQRVHEKLIAAGMKPHMADCLAPRLAHKLTTSQLEALGKAAKLGDDKPDGGSEGHLSLNKLADRLQAVNDPRIVDVVTRSGLACAIMG